MLSSTTTMMIWGSIHLVLWCLTQFFISVTGVTESGCDVFRPFCGTPIDAFIQAGRQIPDLGLLGVVRLVPNLVALVWGLLSVNYEIIRADDFSVVSILWYTLRLAAAAAGIQTVWGAVSNLLNALRG